MEGVCHSLSLDIRICIEPTTWTTNGMQATVGAGRPVYSEPSSPLTPAGAYYNLGRPWGPASMCGRCVRSVLSAVRREVGAGVEINLFALGCDVRCHRRASVAGSRRGPCSVRM